MCRRLVEVRRVGFDYGKTCRRHVVVLTVRFNLCTVCRKLVEVWRVNFVYYKTYRGRVDVQRVRFHNRKRVGSLERFRESVSIAPKRV